MARLRGTVSSLGALATFEAAARLQGFTRAAEELGITQAAVSRQIKLLEADLGTPLFLRGHRKVELTPAGAVLVQSLTGAFDQIVEAIETIRAPQNAKTVTIGATMAFAHFWLLPRLPAFRAAHPDVQLRLVSQDSVFDLRRDTVDMAIIYGTEPFDAGRCLATLADRVLPVCSPAVAARGLPLHSLPLIGCEWVEPTWLSWRKWAQMAGVPPLSRANALRFSHYTDAIYSAMAGEGVALGWEALVAPLIADGRLVVLQDAVVNPAEKHSLVIPTTRPQSRAARMVTEWIAQTFEAAA